MGREHLKSASQAKVEDIVKEASKASKAIVAADGLEVL